jgi:hypothetical protein
VLRKINTLEKELDLQGFNEFGVQIIGVYCCLKDFMFGSDWIVHAYN